VKWPAPATITFADTLTQILCFLAIFPASDGARPSPTRPALSRAATSAAWGAAVPPEATDAEPGAAPAFALPEGLFEPGSAALRPGFEAALEEASRIAGLLPPPHARVEVVLPADSPEAKSALDFRLALARARTLADALARRGGFAPDRLGVAARVARTSSDGGGGAWLVAPAPREDASTYVLGDSADSADRDEGP